MTNKALNKFSKKINKFYKKFNIFKKFHKPIKVKNYNTEKI